jgi:hypothetical protein
MWWKKTFTRTATASIFILAINLSIFSQPISPYLVGNNVWLNPSDEVWKKTSECGLQIVRIGGLAYEDALPANYKDWIKRIRDMGAEPLLQVPSRNSVEYAANLVKDNMDVKFWNIGNETGANAAGIAGYVKPRASAMKAVNPNIKIFVPDGAWYSFTDMPELLGGSADISGKDDKGNYYIDGACWHQYPFNGLAGGWDGMIAQMVKNTVACKKDVDFANKKQGRTGNNKIGWGIGEFNGSGEVGGFPVHSWENGQMFGVVYGLTMKYEGTYACTWSMFENGGNHGGTDFSFLDGNGLTPRASYRHMELIAKNFSGEYIDGVCSVAKLVTYGSIDAAKNKLCAMLINRTGSAYDFALRFDGQTVAAGKTAINMDAKVTGEYTDNIAANNTILLVFTGTAGKKYTYTPGDFDAGKAPSVSDITSPFTVAIRQNAADNPKKTQEIICRQAGGLLAITFSSARKYTLTLTEINGRVVARQSGVGARAEFNTRLLSGGVFCVRVDAENEAVFSRAIVVQ